MTLSLVNSLLLIYNYAMHSLGRPPLVLNCIDNFILQKCGNVKKKKTKTKQTLSTLDQVVQQ